MIVVVDGVGTGEKRSNAGEGTREISGISDFICGGEGHVMLYVDVLLAFGCVLVRVSTPMVLDLTPSFSNIFHHSSDQGCGPTSMRWRRAMTRGPLGIVRVRR